MSSKLFFVKTITYSIILLVIIGAAIIVVDPFVHYHRPWFSLAPVETDERGAQVGIARNTEYDTAMVGSSMSENFQASWFSTEPFGSKAVKLCMQGAHFADYEVLLDEVFKHDNVKTVVFSLDNYLLMNVPAEYPTTIPEYLSNDKLTDDADYFWNKSVAFYYLPIYLLNNIRDDFTEDYAYVWAPNYVFDKYVTRASYTPLRLLKQEDEQPFDAYFQYSNEFIANMTPYIESHPEVDFIFYAPPYSILYWDDSVRHGRLTAEICMLNDVYGKLLTYENVKLYYFQDRWEIISDLDNYKDYSHYSQEINKYMAECMHDGKYELTMDNYYDTLLDFYDTAVEYDYESAFH